MTKYNQVTVESDDVAKTLNSLESEDKQICYVLPVVPGLWARFLIVYKEFFYD